MPQLILKVFLYVVPSSFKLLHANCATQLLEDHFQQLRKEDGEDVDPEAEEDWGNWDVESDDSDSSSESDGWIDVEDDGKDLEVSDSEDEDDADKKDAPEEEAPRISTLATTKASSMNRL